MVDPSYQKLVIPFVGGLDTKSDEKTVIPTKLTVLENGEFTEGGTVRKRLGYEAVPALQTDGSALEGTPKQLATHRDGALLLTSQKAYGFSERDDAWLELGDFSSITYTQDPVVQNNAEQFYAETAVASGVRVTAWEDSRGGVRASVVDEVTGVAYDADKSIASANAARPRVVAVGGVLLIVYVDTNNHDLKYFRIKSWDVATSLAGAVATLVSDLNANHRYDLVSVGSDAVLVYNSDNAVVAGVRACLVNSGGSATSFQQVNSTNAASNIGIYYDSAAAAVLIAFAYGGTPNLHLEKRSASDLTAVATNQPADATYASALRFAWCKAPSGYTVWADFDPAGNDVRYTKALPLTSSMTTSADTTIRHSFLACNGFDVDDSGYVVLGHHSRSGIQNGYYLFNDRAKMVGQILVGEGAGIIDSKDHLPDTRPDEDGTYSALVCFQRETDVEGDGIVAYENRSVMRLTFDGSVTPQVAEAGRTTYAACAQLWALTGEQPVETGFAMFPDLSDSDIGHNANAAANIAAGEIRSYRIYYEWRLNNGERIRSAAITRTFTAVSANEIQISVPTLSFTLKDSSINGVTDVAIVGYKTEANKSDIFYRFTAVDPTTSGDNGYYENDVTADTVTLVDDMSDSDLISNEIDYRSKGEVSHFSAPAGSVVANIQNRLFVSGGSLEDHETAYSLLQVAGRPIEFNEFIDDTLAGRGPVKGIRSINGTPVIFKERSIYLLRGEGPSNVAPDGFYEAVRVTSDVGLKDAGVVVETPKGLIFKSHKGFYLLDQGFNVSYLGAPVEAYNEQTYTAATVIPNSNTVVFLTSSGKTIVYDYFYGEWAAWTNHAGIAAATLNGDTYCYLRSDGTLYRRNTEYTDAGVPYAMRLRTAPLRPEHLQGFWKIRLFQVLGDYRSLHKLKVSLLYDRDEAPSETYTLDPSTFISTDTWGDDATWGASTYWGGSAGGSEYQHGHRPRRSKCQTVRLEFEDIPGTNPGASYELTELAILYRDWGGLARLPNARKY